MKRSLEKKLLKKKKKYKTWLNNSKRVAWQRDNPMIIINNIIANFFIFIYPKARMRYNRYPHPPKTFEKHSLSVQSLDEFSRSVSKVAPGQTRGPDFFFKIFRRHESRSDKTGGPIRAVSSQECPSRRSKVHNQKAHWVGSVYRLVGSRCKETPIEIVLLSCFCLFVNVVIVLILSVI